MFSPEHLANAADAAAKAALKAVESEAKAEMLKEQAKDVLASIKTELEEEHGKAITETKLERLARSTKAWKDFRSGVFNATFEALRAKVQASNAERNWRTIQSALSYQKAEMEQQIRSATI